MPRSREAGSTLAAACVDVQNDLANASAGRMFELRVEDGDVATALHRWSEGSGYRLVWQAPRVSVDGEVSLPARDFIDALGRLLDRLNAVGHRLRFVVSLDGVVQVVRHG